MEAQEALLTLPHKTLASFTFDPTILGSAGHIGGESSVASSMHVRRRLLLAHCVELRFVDSGMDFCGIVKSKAMISNKIPLRMFLCQEG